MFSVSPGLDNYLKLINDSDIFEKIMKYDIESVTEIMMKKLRTYIENPHFRPVDIEPVSKTPSLFCKWIRLVYEYNILKFLVCVFYLSRIIFKYPDF